VDPAGRTCFDEDGGGDPASYPIGRAAEQAPLYNGEGPRVALVEPSLLGWFALALALVEPSLLGWFALALALVEPSLLGWFALALALVEPSLLGWFALAPALVEPSLLGWLALGLALVEPSLLGWFAAQPTKAAPQAPRRKVGSGGPTGPTIEGPTRKPLVTRLRKA